MVGGVHQGCLYLGKVRDGSVCNIAGESEAAGLVVQVPFQNNKDRDEARYNNRGIFQFTAGWFKKEHGVVVTLVLWSRVVVALVVVGAAPDNPPCLLVFCTAHSSL